MVLPRGIAVGGAGPRMMQDVARLEGRLVAGGLEDEIVGEVLAVVSHVESRDEGVGRAGGVGRVAQPEHA